MDKNSNREKLLAEGLKVVCERGFNAASVRDIVQAAGVPQGSFTNHFGSKEQFGLEIIERYFDQAKELMATTLHDATLPPLRRLAAYSEAAQAFLCRDGMKAGCLLGNLSAEASDHSEAMRTRLAAIFSEIQGEIAACLSAAVAAGELPPDFDCDNTAAFILSALQGATLLAKAQRSPAPIERVRQMLFASVLH
jgi:TetR/AcrR family transcriptional repressor of nem operon